MQNTSPWRVLQVKPIYILRRLFGQLSPRNNFHLCPNNGQAASKGHRCIGDVRLRLKDANI